ncbi:MAG: ribonuclease G [Moraxellaceae bacterium]|jgi:ribonuclease G|nr:ribonuclease G [Moraxellaceae bacterium]MBP7229699.1 ribonuclease G [Moraxellaceae bacterium]MBP8851577.1 ribonuclease G [Moraxellaceae bacterium]MBP9045353.1 ribonuclease G [Moraxellaceae bacterium]MBP9730027.1 ribonuclease G [Moraxellaceae bacterium]
MSEEILINVTPMECRVARVENGVVQELYVERTARRGLVGSIYKGRVVRVLPGMQAAFVEIGLSRTAFIHANDIVWPKVEGERERTPVISELLHEGQSVIVQAMKDMMGSKGARLTTDLSIPSRYLVYMPKGEHIGVSQRIEDEAERERLKSLIRQLKAESPDTEAGGFIVRTVAEGVSEHELRRDMQFLVKLWRWVQERCVTAATPSLIYEELPLFMRTLRDLVDADVEKILIDSRETFVKMQEFVHDFMPQMQDRLEHYPGERPLFDLCNVEDDLQKALQRKVMLKSGGYLIIDQTEAMTTVDVNTGSFVGSRNLEDTVFKTNLEATHVIARQLRLRNLGGIIIIDFIDMQEVEHRQQVLRSLEKMLVRDHAKNKITQVSELGLVEMTRKRTRESLEHLLCEACPACQGRGAVKTAETVCYEVFREILREARAYDAAHGYQVVANQKVIDRLLGEDSAAVADLELFIGKPIRFSVEALYTQEQFDIVLL